MRKTQYLIREARQNTNTTDVEAITEYLCVSLLNRAQEFIQAFLFTQNIEAKIFRKSYILNTSSGVEEYALPSDVYAKNSINNIMYKNGDTYSPLKQIAEKARGVSTGYFLSDSNIILSPMPQFTQVFNVSYTRRLPSLALSYGSILSVAANTSITLNAGYTELTGVDDFFCVVDSDGVIIKQGLIISQVGDVLSLSDTTSILAGHFVVPGKYATTLCQLPDELESAMIMSLENSINARLSSKDIGISKPLTDEMLAQIGSMFADNTTDTFMPPMVEYSEWL
jgi:hypothetical protein